MGEVSAITKAAKELDKFERKLVKVETSKTAAVAKATAKAEKKYDEKIIAAQEEVAGARKTLTELVAKA